MHNFENERLGLEKRKGVRIEVELKVLFIIVGDEKNSQYPAVTRNISQGGMCLAINDNKAELLEKLKDKQRILRVSLELTDQKSTAETRTRTSWISSNIDWMVMPAQKEAPILLGLAYRDMPDSARDRINTFIADLIIKQRSRRLS